jgi:hypothetical protein
MKDKIYGLIRHLLSLGAGVLIMKGVIDENASAELIGAIMTVIAFGWSWYNKETFQGTEDNKEA